VELAEHMSDMPMFKIQQLIQIMRGDGLFHKGNCTNDLMKISSDF
jgi:hypothetical protein